MSEETIGRRVKVSAEVVVEILDEAAVHSAALAAIADAQFSTDSGETAEELRADERDTVKEDLAAAVDWLVDPAAVVDGHESIAFVEGSYTVTEIVNDGRAIPRRPDFARLFPLCRCGDEDCFSCGGVQLTPRTAAALWSMAQLRADQGYDDVGEHGDDPVTQDAVWAVFDEYPPITWRHNAVWRRQAARAFDDLADDLASGKEPLPTCPGEEMALHLTLRLAKAAVTEQWESMIETLTGLPEHPDDFAWRLLPDHLFQDHDILNLFDAELDGIEDPQSEPNRRIAMGDYRPHAWFDTFSNMTSRDGRRPFRR